MNYKENRIVREIEKMKGKKFYTFVLEDSDLDEEWRIKANNKKEAYKKLQKYWGLKKSDVVLDEVSKLKRII